MKITRAKDLSKIIPLHQNYIQSREACERNAAGTAENWFSCNPPPDANELQKKFEDSEREYRSVFLKNIFSFST